MYRLNSSQIGSMLFPLFLSTVCIAGIALGAAPCRIEVVDKENGWPVPLVEFRTTHDLVLVTDNAGVIAVDQPELFNREIWFTVSGHGYYRPRDGFGNSGVRITPKPGETIRVEVERKIIAKRLGRVTGGGIFAEAQKFGEYADWQESGVFGCDTIQSTVHRGKRFWLWGDTDLPRYALGIFDSSSATSQPRPLSGFEPPIGLHFDYFRDAKGVPRGVAPMPGPGPTWITGYVSLPDKSGQQRLVAHYAKIKPPLEGYENGLCVWNDDKQEFEHLRTLWRKDSGQPKPALQPTGHPIFWRDEQGREWLLLGNPFPEFRCPATLEAWQDESTWQQLQPQEKLRTVDGEKIEPHAGSIAWNDFRERWVTVFCQSWGKPSMLGELWYAEAESPTGPWGPAIKVLSHDNYTFYNPRLHQDFTEPGSPILLFEGTYTTTFADRPQPTPRYDYNQIMYRLDLDDPALKPAQP
jgi:hypothetical protein